jgi:hypothetical protein
MSKFWKTKTSKLARPKAVGLEQNGRSFDYWQTAHEERKVETIAKALSGGPSWYTNALWHHELKCTKRKTAWRMRTHPRPPKSKGCGCSIVPKTFKPSMPTISHAHLASLIVQFHVRQFAYGSIMAFDSHKVFVVRGQSSSHLAIVHKPVPAATMYVRSDFELN